MKAVAIIPARMGSSRFPGKPLAQILGRPMIQWVYEGTKACGSLARVIIATCDAEIEAAARAFGAQVVMTSPRHERASDRVAEAAAALNTDVVVMVQGDEPMVVPAMIEEALRPFDDPAVDCTNLSSAIDTEADFHDVNTVKVVVNRRGDALYFSRAPVPSFSRRDGGSVLGHRQVCVIGFRATFLQRYTQLEPTALERSESIDMLRILEHGFAVRIVPTSSTSYPVDTEADRRRVEQLLAGRR